MKRQREPPPTACHRHGRLRWQPSKSGITHRGGAGTMIVMAPARPRGFLVSIIHVVTGNNFAKRHPATDPRLWRMEHASRAVPEERAGRDLGLNPAVSEAKVLVGATSRPCVDALVPVCF